MAAIIVRGSFQWRQDTRDDWATKNPVLDSGEPGYEVDTGNFKVGDGVKRWTQLMYFVPGGGSGGGDSGAIEALVDHINSQYPHNVYDDMPSLVLIYQNAKV